MARSHATSALFSASFHVSLLLLLMATTFLNDPVYAKRGCSAFGHSCFGGHGKRFDPNFQENLQDGKTMSNKIDEYSNADVFLIDQRKLHDREERSFGGAPYRDARRLDPYPLLMLLPLRRRPQQADVRIANK